MSYHPDTRRYVCKNEECNHEVNASTLGDITVSPYPNRERMEIEDQIRQCIMQICRLKAQIDFWEDRKARLRAMLKEGTDNAKKEA